jgi:hypothetical protein
VVFQFFSVMATCTTIQGQSRWQARSVVTPTGLVTFLGLLAQSIAALAREIGARGWRLRPGCNNDPTSLDTASSKMLIAGSHTALMDLLRELQAGGGFIAVQQGSHCAVVASVNSLPVGHRLELSGDAAADRVGPIRWLEARSAPPGQLEEMAIEPAEYPDRGFELAVEQAVKGLSDYSALEQSGLASRMRLQPAPHIEQAKRLRRILVEAIERLRPAGDPPNGVLPRDWHAYTTLHDAYIDDVPNRDIMSKLYISEGTFNRQRRKALRAVATAMWEFRQ